VKEHGFLCPAASEFVNQRQSFRSRSGDHSDPERIFFALTLGSIALGVGVLMSGGIPVFVEVIPPCTPGGGTSDRL